MLAQFLETGTSEQTVKVDAIVETVDFDWSLGGGRESSLDILPSSAKAGNNMAMHETSPLCLHLKSWM